MQSRWCVSLLVLALSPLAAATAGADPDIRVTPGSVAFGNVMVGQTAVATLTVSNVGNATLIISGIVPPAPPFSFASNGCPGTLSPGASCPIAVRFAPPAPGTFAGNVIVSSN